MPARSDIIDNMKVVCQCRNIRKGTFKKLMAGGAGTLAGLQKATGAGAGDCGGKRCRPRLEQLLANEK